MDQPSDVDLVQSAIRLGWFVAEVRGRNRPNGPPGSVLRVPKRIDHPLPLRVERSATEQRMEAQAALTALAQKLNVDQRSGHSSLSGEIDTQAAALWQARQPTAGAKASESEDDLWKKLAETLWDLDANIQDTLTASSDTQACGYQLGRGLAECYWALDPDPIEGWDSWTFLFDRDRCGELTRLVGRLSGYMNAFAASAIAGSLQVWELLASDKAWRTLEMTQADLCTQIRTWYQLTVLGQDPSRDIQPYQLVRNWRVIARALQTFLPQLLLAGIGLVALCALVFVVNEAHSSPTLATLAALLAAAGISSAGLTARLKNQAQALSVRFRQDAYTDLIALAITTVPDPPDNTHGRSRQAVIEKTVRERVLTPSTPFDGRS